MDRRRASEEGPGLCESWVVHFLRRGDQVRAVPFGAGGVCYT